MYRKGLTGLTSLWGVLRRRIGLGRTREALNCKGDVDYLEGALKNLDGEREGETKGTKVRGWSV